MHFAGRSVSGDIARGVGSLDSTFWHRLYKRVRGVASRVLSQHAETEEFKLTLHASLLGSKEALARGLEADRVAFLEDLARDAKIASDASMSREAWQRDHRLLRFGGRDKTPMAFPICLMTRGKLSPRIAR